jgi:CDGSH-type Zn-finger protein
VDPLLRFVRGGPLRVSGEVPVVRLRKIDQGSDAKPLWRASLPLSLAEPLRLCRCGATTTPPVCDHPEDGVCFVEPQEPSEPLPVAWTIDGLEGPALALKPNGPIRMQGGIRMTGPDEIEHRSVDRCSICRCGNSAALPFCDGTHKIVGYRERG